MHIEYINDKLAGVFGEAAVLRDYLGYINSPPPLPQQTDEEGNPLPVDPPLDYKKLAQDSSLKIKTMVDAIYQEVYNG